MGCLVYRIYWKCISELFDFRITLHLRLRLWVVCELGSLLKSLLFFGLCFGYSSPRRLLGRRSTDRTCRLFGMAGIGSLCRGLSCLKGLVVKFGSFFLFGIVVFPM